MPIDERFGLGVHAFATSDGATLTYFVCGTGSRVLVNVAPGWGCASQLYQNSFQFLEDAFTFVHLEVRGTRGSSFPHDLASMSGWHMSEDVEALRIYLGLDTFEHLQGHSNGGCIAVWYAIKYPTRVDNLVLLDAGVLGPDVDSVSRPATNAILDARPERDAVREFQNWFQRTFESDAEFGRALNVVLPLYFARPARDIERFRHDIFTNTPQAKCFQAQKRADRQHAGQAEHLGEVCARTLVVVGRHDFICPVPVSELITQRIPGATLRIIEDCGHFPWIEQTDECDSLLRAFYGL